MIRASVWTVGYCWLLCGAATAATPAGLPTQAPAWFVAAAHAPSQPRSGEAVRITVRVQPTVASVMLQCQFVEPGAYIELRDLAYKTNWISFSMQPEKTTNDSPVLSAEVPGSFQKHRRLVRYRFTATDPSGLALQAPGSETAPANLAYFVYDGIPAWAGAIHPASRETTRSTPLAFSPEAMRRVQAYHLIGKKSSVENVTWRQQSWDKEYRYTGTLVADGVVYDHVRYRARGGTWRYALGKNMWKFDLPNEHRLEARDDFGRLYPVVWDKLNLRACIQQGDYGCRGEQGMFEAVGFRLFNLAGVVAPFTHWIQLRIIDEAEESPANQYRGDFWGLYLAIENEDGRFLKAHRLPDGNLYKMANGSGELSHHGAGAATNRTDLDRFLGTYYGGNPPETWWSTNLELASYYSYRAICECIHHYDIGDGKNYDYYHNPKTGRWHVIPWDIDLTWADHMYGSGEEPFKHRVLSKPRFHLEYQNQLRELRDLLFNPEQTGQLIDECAAVIWDPTGAPSMVEADRRKWDFHPAMAAGGKAGQGRFYEAAPTQDFPGMVQFMKNFVRSRGAWIDSYLLNDPKIPATPTASYIGGPNFSGDGLRFRAGPYQGPNPWAALRWRLAEINPAPKTSPGLPKPGFYEITPLWESSELGTTTNEISIPAGYAKAGHTYRVRVRMKDDTGRWSHWSPPVEFVAGK